MKKLTIALLAAFALTATAATASAEQKFISIGTGGITGVYYPTGGAICRLVNKERKTTGIRCSVELTGGSVYNINTIQSGELEFGVAQSDVQYNAYNGKAQWDGKPFKNLRAVFSVHPEPVTIIARADANIHNISDLKGKRLNIGNPGSGTYATWEIIEAALGWKREDLKLAAELKSAETGQALCDNKIDAYYWLVGHPSALTEETLNTCDFEPGERDGTGGRQAGRGQSLLPQGRHPGRHVQQQGGHPHLRRGRHLRHLGGCARRGGLCGRQGGHVQSR